MAFKLPLANTEYTGKQHWIKNPIKWKSHWVKIPLINILLVHYVNLINAHQTHLPVVPFRCWH